MTHYALPPIDQLPGLDREWTLDDLLAEIVALREDRKQMQDCIRIMARYIPQGELSPRHQDRTVIKMALRLMDLDHELMRLDFEEMLAVLVKVIGDYMRS